MLCWIASFLFTCTHRKQAKRPSGWLAINFTLQKQTSLLTNCTNPWPLNFIRLDIHPATLMWMWNFNMEPEKHRRKFLHVTLQICTKALPGHRLAPFIFYFIYFQPRNSERKKRAETRSRYGAATFSAFFPCVPCVSASHTPAFPAPLSQIQRCSIVIWHL